MILPDLLAPNLDLVFCGTAAGNTSAEYEEYYAGPGNKFYPILHKTGLTPRRLEPWEYKMLLKFNIGLTDMVKGKSGNDNAFTNSDFNRDEVAEKILNYHPRFVAFNGKKAASAFLYNTLSRTGDVNYGPVKLNSDIQFFVLPSTSGSANGFWDPSYWHTLAKLVKER